MPCAGAYAKTPMATARYWLARVTRRCRLGHPHPHHGGDSCGTRQPRRQIILTIGLRGVGSGPDRVHERVGTFLVPTIVSLLSRFTNTCAPATWFLTAVRFVHLYRRWRGLAELSVGHRSSGALPPGGLVGHSRLAPLGVRWIIVRRLVSRMPRVRCVVPHRLAADAWRLRVGSASTRAPSTVGFWFHSSPSHCGCWRVVTTNQAGSGSFR